MNTIMRLINNNIILFYVLLLILGLTVQKAFSICPDLNSPRVGDELTVLGLDNINLTDVGREQCVDLSNAKI